MAPQTTTKAKPFPMIPQSRAERFACYKLVVPATLLTFAIPAAMSWLHLNGVW